MSMHVGCFPLGSSTEYFRWDLGDNLLRNATFRMYTFHVFSFFTSYEGTFVVHSEFFEGLRFLVYLFLGKTTYAIYMSNSRDVDV